MKTPLTETPSGPPVVAVASRRPKTSCPSADCRSRQPAARRSRACDAGATDSGSRPDILPRLANGKPGAAQECFDRYGRLVWSLAHSYDNDSLETEDAVQEVFLTLWKNASRYDPTKSPESAFVNMVARRRLIDFYFRKKKMPKTVPAEPEVVDSMPDPRSLDAETLAEANLASRVLDTLKPGEREALMMSIYLGMSHTEIARHMAKPLGTVKTYILRGLKRAREAVRSEARQLSRSRQSDGRARA